ncbi:helix-turn-helix domain-containing protein [Vibrio campbellii]|uniref:helix-turn-helix domain-containing protein n=1 Tax=unclassified Vibrio TaxID=2614977 RepID=UPI00406A7F31
MKDIEEITKLLVTQRKKLGIEQKDMYMRIGMKQQQYQRIEAGSDVRLSTLLRVLEGLDLELMIAPKGLTTKSPVGGSTSSFQPLKSLENDGDDLDFWFGSKR